MKPHRVPSPVIAMTVSAFAMACGSNANNSIDPGIVGGSPTGSGGTTTSTPTNGGNTSGTTPAGGATAVTGQGGSSNGGASTNGAGGTTSSAGGATSNGGATANGGATSNGGAKASGGATPNGGATNKGGATSNGGSTSKGGTSSGGTASGGVVGSGGATSKGGTGNGGAASGGTSSAGGTTATGTRPEGPCDIYAAANTPCVAAYSMARALTKNYTGPLYQVRSGSSAQNTGTGGTLKDIGMLDDGYADAAAQDAFCNGTYCTVSKLYDQSGKGNHLTVAKKGRSDGGTYGATDDFESTTGTKGAITAGGHKVYSLYMAAREGYRLQAVGAGMPRGTAAEGIYMLADGTHYGTACCWDFGNVTTDPTVYGVMNTLFFGVAYWGRGAGNGPWFMADFEAGVWAGGSKAGDPGWGALDTTSPANTNNPSLKVPWAFGILKTTTTNYALRMADLAAATTLTTAYSGALPKAMNNLGGIVLGVGGDNSNNSWGTFFEGAITAGAPSDETDLAVFQNAKAVGYTK